MTLDLHGYHIRFDRDQRPSSSSWKSAHALHNEYYGHEHEHGHAYHYHHHQDPVLSELSYFYPIALVAVLLLCLHGIICIFGMHSGYYYVRQKYVSNNAQRDVRLMSDQ
mmetsp:Transcript_28132/g.46297  ORF Transcript_28132/g.46297 Transcript_28132/m.46297 type:complete len:109 (-) Transcript_28132:34-360(-)